MARIRTIKPSFWGDEGVLRLSFDARLVLIGLISMADDDGRFLASTNAITGHIFPNDTVTPSRLKRWLSDIEGTGMVGFYEVDGIKYGVFPKYRKHQRISKPMPSPLPAPPAGFHT